MTEFGHRQSQRCEKFDAILMIKYGVNRPERGSNVTQLCRAGFVVGLDIVINFDVFKVHRVIDLPAMWINSEFAGKTANSAS